MNLSSVSNNEPDLLTECPASQPRKPPSKKRDRVIEATTDGSLFVGADEFCNSQEVNDIINLLPICYVGNKKRMLMYIWRFLEEEGVRFDTVFDAFSGSCVFSFMSLMMGKHVVSNDIMSYPSLLAVSLFGPKKMCPSDSDLLRVMGDEIDPSNNIHVADQWEGMFFTEKECKFLNSYRSNMISLYGPSVFAGELTDGRKKIISLVPGCEAKETDGMRSNSFMLYLILTLLHQLCFTGGRYFRRQLIARLEYRLDHIRNKGEEIYSKPMDFMWLKEIRQFMNILEAKKEEGGGTHKFVSDDIMNVLTSGNAPSADLVYLDPPYGGLSSNYVEIYRLFEEYIYGVKPDRVQHLVDHASRFKKPAGYREQFEEVLDQCDRYESWLISYNERSFASLEQIYESVRRFRSRVDIMETDIKYRYRKGTGKGNEFTILARQ